jgi:hypothetical protein
VPGGLAPRRVHQPKLVAVQQQAGWYVRVTKEPLETRLRRTFISLTLADGGRKDILRWITHGPTGDVFDSYQTLPWATYCEELGKLRAEPPAREAQRLVANADSPTGPLADRVTVGVTVESSASRKPAQLSDPTLESDFSNLAGWTGLEPAASGVTGRRYNQA